MRSIRRRTPREAIQRLAVNRAEERIALLLDRPRFALQVLAAEVARRKGRRAYGEGRDQGVIATFITPSRWLANSS
ncbi:hypothetical protein [Pseudomonas sp. UBA6310]|uniref:hypothetical protein n=1 Tax=Pseudomonas sp. UBA6310 TaxID=1947327 RepID=UPI00257DBD7C|nr:hypothetical protein [Pseudomonas sp. UBA6310]